MDNATLTEAIVEVDNFRDEVAEKYATGFDPGHLPKFEVSPRLLSALNIVLRKVLMDVITP